MIEEKCHYIPTDIYCKSVWEIKCNIDRGSLKVNSSELDDTETYLELAMSGVALPNIYAKGDKFGNMEIIKGANIINSLLKYINNKKNVEKYRARIADVKITIIKIQFCRENNSRIDYIENLINKI